MQAAITVSLRIFDVILALDQRDIVLLQQAVGEHVNIVHKGADDTDACDVEDVVFNCLEGKGQLFFEAFCPECCRGTLSGSGCCRWGCGRAGGKAFV